MSLQTPAAGPHTFHIPVMGTGFTMDTPLRVARYGINSVVSLGDDSLMERLRCHYSQLNGLPFEAIPDTEEDCRARRITAWLNFMQSQIDSQTKALKNSSFSAGSELGKYYSLLPPGSLKDTWETALALNPDDPKRKELENCLRNAAVAGNIDVNIMTKVDRSFTPAGIPMASDSSDALAGLRGFARSRLNSTVVFSAGMNPRLYGYITTFDDFFPDINGNIKKQVCLKVSDYRSAEIQGRFLAKKGIWISEFRIESGLNCGGHAFAPQGQLLGPILEEFKTKSATLKQELYVIWSKALLSKRGSAPALAPDVKMSIQGGVGTSLEHQQLLDTYGAHSVGWGTPFLLVPEATLVDAEHLKKLCDAEEGDVELSDASPLGIPFWSLRNSSSELLRRKRIAEGKPGSPCLHSYLIFNTEFGPKPICSSSRAYQRKKLEALDHSGLSGEALEEAKQIVMSHSCICMDLGGTILNELKLEVAAPVAICPGPNLIWFNRQASLEEMLGHIYGRISLFSKEVRNRRPHMFLAEIKLTVDYLAREWHRSKLGLNPRSADYFEEYRNNLREGMRYYMERSSEIFGRSRSWLEEQMAEFQERLADLEATISLPMAKSAA